MALIEPLIKIDGKPIEKLLEVVSSGLGIIYRPRQIRREADAQAYAIKVIGKAQAEIDAEKRMIEFDTEERIAKRIMAQESRRQNNIDSVVEMTARYLSGETVSDQPVDEDWATRFFNIAQDVSKKEMKDLWARILAKEVKTPSSVSIRTLEVLRNITAEEARTFEKIAPLILFENGYFLYRDQDVLNKFGVQYYDRALLTECGILQSGVFVNKTYKDHMNEGVEYAFKYGHYVVFMTLDKGKGNVKIPVTLLTKAGQELFELIEPDANMEYLSSFADGVKRLNPTIHMQYAELLSNEGKNYIYREPLIDL